MAEQDLSDPKTSTVLEWLLMPDVRRTVERSFRKFLIGFRDQNNAPFYGNRIAEIAIGK